MPEVTYPVKTLIESNRAEIARRLPTYMSEQQFFNLCYSIERNQSVMEVLRKNPDSVLNAIMKAADLGLLIGSGNEHCWLIKYDNSRTHIPEIQLQIGYHGLVYLLVRAGAIIKLEPKIVYEIDDFQMIEGNVDQYRHVRPIRDPHYKNSQWLNDKNSILGAYGIAYLPLPTKYEHIATIKRYVPLGEIEAARAKSKAPDSPAWKYSYPAMALKTAVRRTCKMIEVCGPTAENKEAWERFSRTIELEKSQYRSDPDSDDTEAPQESDLPPMRPVKQLDKSVPRVSGRVAGSKSTEHGTPPPQDGSRGKLRVEDDVPAPTPPPVKPEEPISFDQQNELMAMATTAQINPMDVLAFVKEKFGIAGLDVTPSQAAELKKFIRQQGMGEK